MILVVVFVGRVACSVDSDGHSVETRAFMGSSSERFEDYKAFALNERTGELTE